MIMGLILVVLLRSRGRYWIGVYNGLVRVRAE